MDKYGKKCHRISEKNCISDVLWKNENLFMRYEQVLIYFQSYPKNSEAEVNPPAPIFPDETAHP